MGRVYWIWFMKVVIAPGFYQQISKFDLLRFTCLLTRFTTASQCNILNNGQLELFSREETILSQRTEVIYFWFLSNLLKC